jgi:hypothetical protein
MDQFLQRVYLFVPNTMPETSTVESLRPRLTCICKLFFDASSMHFLDALDRMRWCKCSDQRDRVSTTMVLDNDYGVSIDIQPDYTKSVQAVYSDAITNFLEAYKNLEFLSLVEISEASLSLPSWVPDWSAQEVVNPFNYHHAAALTRSAARIDTEREALRVHGIT